MIGRAFIAPAPPVRVDLSALIAHVCMVLEDHGRKDLVTDMQHLRLHLRTTALRFYNGQKPAVDEFLQLYSLDEWRGGFLARVKADEEAGHIPAKADTKPITIPGGLCC